MNMKKLFPLIKRKTASSTAVPNNDTIPPISLSTPQILPLSLNKQHEPGRVSDALYEHIPSALPSEKNIKNNATTEDFSASVFASLEALETHLDNNAGEFDTYLAFNDIVIEQQQNINLKASNSTILSSNPRASTPTPSISKTRRNSYTPFIQDRKSFVILTPKENDTYTHFTPFLFQSPEEFMDSRQNFSTLLTPSKTPSSPMTLKLPSPTKSFTSTISKNSYPLLSPTSKKHIPNITMVHDFNAQLPSDSETYSDDDEGVFFNGAVKKSSLKAKKVSRRKLRTPTVAVDKLTPSSSKKSSKVVNTSELKRENLVPKYLQVGSPFSS